MSSRSWLKADGVNTRPTFIKEFTLTYSNLMSISCKLLCLLCYFVDHNLLKSLVMLTIAKKSNFEKNYSTWTSFPKRFVSTNMLFRTLVYCTLKHRIKFPSGKSLWKFVFNRASTLNINFSIWSQFAINSFPWTKLPFVIYSNSRNFSKIKSLI